MRHPSLPLALRCALAAAPIAAAGAASAAATVPDLAGTWAGTLMHEGDSTAVALAFERVGGDTLRLRLSLPVIHLDDVPLGRFVPERRGDSIVCGPFRFAHDARAERLDGIMPRGLIPVYRIPFELRRVERFEMPARAPLDAPARAPLWVFDAGAPAWAGTRYADGTVYAGTGSGAVHALDALTGERRWTFLAGGAVRVRPTVDNGAVYFQADDGFLYRLDAATGALGWKRRIVEAPIERLPFDDSKSRFDRFGADVLAVEGRLFVGTHDGRMLALDPETGAERWSFAAGDAILAAPALDRGILVFGSYDGRIHGLEARTGRSIWSFDAKAPVVSTPALHRGAAVVGTRGYDLLALGLGDGVPAWKRYMWMSWVESSAGMMDDVAYVGSSDAAAVFAYHVPSGRRLWKTDVHGWAWGRPATTPARLYVGTSGQVGYPVEHRGELLALELASGRALWKYAAAKPDSGAYGFPGSACTGLGRVFAAGLDGRVYAFEQ